MKLAELFEAQTQLWARGELTFVLKTREEIPILARSLKSVFI